MANRPNKIADLSLSGECSDHGSRAFLVQKEMRIMSVQCSDRGGPNEKMVDNQEPTDTSKKTIRTCYLGHVSGYQGSVFPDSVGSCG